METVVERSNMRLALHLVESNRGIDNMGVGELRGYLKEHWPKVKAKLLEGSHQPQAVRRAEIVKPTGGMRQLGIPTVIDRLIQQALNQVLSPIFDLNFSESSYGFRNGRNAHQAVREAQAYVASGKRWLVDIDLEKFFDRVNHDILMSRVARRVERASRREDRSRRYYPTSCSTIWTELERRGLWFCRYADCNIRVSSGRGVQRVLASVRNFLERRLKLKVNLEKSAVARPWEGNSLVTRMTLHLKPRLKVAPIIGEAD